MQTAFPSMPELGKCALINSVSHMMNPNLQKRFVFFQLLPSKQ